VSGRAVPHHPEHVIELRHPAIDPVRSIDSPAVSIPDIRLHQHLEVGRATATELISKHFPDGTTP
jgi:hypothetical protein